MTGPNRDVILTRIAPETSHRPVAVVTGGARGIGAATARHLVAHGWAVGVLDRCADDPELAYPLASHAQMATLVRDFPDFMAAIEVDVRDRPAIEVAIGQVVERFGQLDAVVTSAGAIAGGTPTWETAPALWSAMIDINLTGTFNAVSAAIPHLLARPAPRHGRVVAIASAAATHGLPMLAGYCAAKHGVVGLVRSLARELGESGVTVNAIAPGSTDTELLKASSEIYGVGSAMHFERHQATGMLIEPSEIANTVEWLLRPTTRSTTGAVIAVDGGFHG